MTEKHWTAPLENLVKSKKIQFSLGLVLLVSSVFEIFFLEPTHSIALIGVFHMASALPNLLQAAERIVKGSK